MITSAPPKTAVLLISSPKNKKVNIGFTNGSTTG